MKTQDEQIFDIIKQLAEQMPVVMEHSTELHRVDGTELIAQGHTEIEPGVKVVAGIKYQQNMPVMIAINHERRMRKAYKKNGQQGLLNYVDMIKNMAIQNIQS